MWGGFAVLLQGLLPSEIIRQGFYGHAVEAIQPKLESVVIGVDILNGISALSDELALVLRLADTQKAL
jgi:hypothetical protein